MPRGETRRGGTRSVSRRVLVPLHYSDIFFFFLFSLSYMVVCKELVGTIAGPVAAVPMGSFLEEFPREKKRS
jgi:hypothetical protein